MPTALSCSMFCSLQPIMRRSENVHYSRLQRNKLLIEIKNSYTGEITMQDGLPVTDQEGHGYGCRGIRSIVEHHHGLCAFESENGIFTLGAVLPVHSDTLQSKH